MGIKYNHVGRQDIPECHITKIGREPVRFQKVSVAAEAVELAPWAATGMPIRPQIIEPQPAAIVAMAMGTKVPGGIDLTRPPVGWRHGSGPYRRRGSALHGLVLTQRTVGLVRQTCESFGLTGAVTLGLDGISWPLGQPTGWGRPEVGQHDAQPHQDQDHQLIVEEVWYHGIASLHGGERRPFYPVFERSELSAGLGYTALQSLGAPYPLHALRSTAGYG